MTSAQLIRFVYRILPSLNKHSLDTCFALDAGNSILNMTRSLPSRNFSPFISIQRGRKKLKKKVGHMSRARSSRLYFFLLNQLPLPELFLLHLYYKDLIGFLKQRCNFVIKFQNATDPHYLWIACLQIRLLTTAHL